MKIGSFLALAVTKCVTIGKLFFNLIVNMRAKMLTLKDFLKIRINVLSLMTFPNACSYLVIDMCLCN